MSKSRPLDGLPPSVFRRRAIGCAIVFAICLLGPALVLGVWMTYLWLTVEF